MLAVWSSGARSPCQQVVAPAGCCTAVTRVPAATREASGCTWASISTLHRACRMPDSGVRGRLLAATASGDWTALPAAGGGTGDAAVQRPLRRHPWVLAIWQWYLTVDACGKRRSENAYISRTMNATAQYCALRSMLSCARGLHTVPLTPPPRDSLLSRLHNCAGLPNGPRCEGRKASIREKKGKEVVRPSQAAGVPACLTRRRAEGDDSWERGERRGSTTPWGVEWACRRGVYLQGHRQPSSGGHNH